MADEAPPKKKGSFTTIFIFAIAFIIIFDPKMRALLGGAVGYVFDPIIGFNGGFPVLTIMIAGTLMVLATTAIRHFTTDWLEQAKFQAHMRAFQKEFGAARKENNTYRLKILTERQPEMMAKQQKVSMAQMKTMPFTMLVVIPLFAWMAQFLTTVEFTFFTAPWNPSVNMFTTNGIFGPSKGSVFPHWILLYMTLSIPLGAFVQKSMKFLSWRRRWQPKHPDVHED